MWWFRVLFVFDALALLVLLYFFVDGLQYGGAQDIMDVWLPILAVPGAVLIGAWTLKEAGKRWLGSLMLALLAVPPFFYLMFIVMMLVMQPDFR